MKEARTSLIQYRKLRTFTVDLYGQPFPEHARLRECLGECLFCRERGEFNGHEACFARLPIAPMTLWHWGGPSSFRVKLARSMIGCSDLTTEILSACLTAVVDEAETPSHLSKPVSNLDAAFRTLWFAPR